MGTGRIALPLIRTGLRVDGIEQSRHMVDRLREKPDGNRVEVVAGDMSRVTTGRRYGLVYLVYNTIGNLLTQDDQVRCFQNAARHLDPGGVFVLECRVPSAPARPGRQFVDAEVVEASHVVLGVCRYDPVTQILDNNHVRISAEGIVLEPDQAPPGACAGVRSHGPHRRAPAARAVGRLEQRALHRGELASCERL